jgi:DNA replication licensing factor MCM6
VRQLESLVRLSEAMARAHCDPIIKPFYVREVCRLMKTSNISIVKGDIDLPQDIQQEINRDRQAQRGEQMEVEEPVAQDQQEGKKVKISFDEFKKLAIMIMKEFERAGDDNVRQGDIVERMVQKLELDEAEHQVSLERTLETSKKVANVISYLINNENLLMISQDAKVKNDRYLTLNVNTDLEQLQNMLSGQGQ